MTSFFNSVTSGFEFIVSFIQSIYRGLITTITVISNSTVVLTALSGILPTIIYSGMILFVGVTVVRKIFGR